MDRELTKEFYLAMNTLHWLQDEPNPYSDQYEHLLVFATDKSADRTHSYLYIEGPYDLVIEQCRYEVVRSLLQTNEHTGFKVIEAQELRDGRLKLKLSKTNYSGD